MTNAFKKAAAPKSPKKFDTREGWLKEMTRLFRIEFAKGGVVVPEKIRVALSFTSTGRRSVKAGGHYGECWAAEASSDASHEIMIHLTFDDPVFITKILAHELLHAACPMGAGHGKVYQEAGEKAGLVASNVDPKGKPSWTMALPGEALNEKIVAWVEKLGPLPHAKLNTGDDTVIITGTDTKVIRPRIGGEGSPQRQVARLLKAHCKHCGYTVRVTKKWVDAAGTPICPTKGHGKMALG